MKRQWKRFLNNEAGAATIVEATVVFPIVLLMLGFLILTAMFLLQKSALYSDAQRLALMASRVRAFPNYGDYGDLVTNTIDFPKEAQLDRVLEADLEAYLYRYWRSNGTEVAELEAAFQQLLASNRFIFSNRVDCSIEVRRNLLQEEIVVTATNLVTLPSFVTILNLEKAIGIDVMVVATVSDPAEFVRNTDLAFDFYHFLEEKTTIGSQIGSFLADFQVGFDKLKKER